MNSNSIDYRLKNEIIMQVNNAITNLDLISILNGEYSARRKNFSHRLGSTSSINTRMDSGSSIHRTNLNNMLSQNSFKPSKKKSPIKFGLLEEKRAHFADTTKLGQTHNYLQGHDFYNEKHCFLKSQTPIKSSLRGSQSNMNFQNSSPKLKINSRQPIKPVIRDSRLEEQIILKNYLYNKLMTNSLKDSQNIKQKLQYYQQLPSFATFCSCNLIY